MRKIETGHGSAAYVSVVNFSAEEGAVLELTIRQRKGELGRIVVFADGTHAVYRGRVWICDRLNLATATYELIRREEAQRREAA